jgi:hypothetical protein
VSSPIEREVSGVVVSYDVGDFQCGCHAGNDFNGFRLRLQNPCGVILPLKKNHRCEHGIFQFVTRDALGPEFGN